MMLCLARQTLLAPLGRAYCGGRPRRTLSWKSPSRILIGALTALSLLGSSSQAEDSETTAADLLPASIIAYAEIREPGSAIERVLNHPLAERVESMGLVDVVRQNRDLDQARKGLAAFEGTMGRPWKEAIDVLTDGGVHVAFDGDSQGVAMLIRSSETDSLERFRNFALAIGQLGGGTFGISETMDYKGLPVYSVNEEIKMALAGHWMIVVNRRELGKAILDRYLQSGQPSLSEVTAFTTAINASDKDLAQSDITAYVDLQQIRSANDLPRLKDGKTPNIAAEALLGGLLSNLQKTPTLTARLKLGADGIKLSATTPHRLEWGQGREYFFGERGDAVAPPLLSVPDQIFAASTYRDLSQMWLLAPDLMTDKANEQLAQADTNLTTFFSGRDFGEDILGSLEPGIQLVVAPQDFPDDSPMPAIKLPAFAFRFTLKDQEETSTEFRRVFQNFVGFINVVGAMQGQPQFDLGYQKGDQSDLVMATYVPPRDRSDYTAAPINYNFSPALGFAGSTMVLSSSAALAETLLAAASRDSAAGTVNTEAQLNADALASILRNNESQLVAQNMIEKGHTREEATGEINLLLELLGMFQDLSLDLSTNGDQLKLSAHLKVDTQ